MSTYPPDSDYGETEPEAPAVLPIDGSRAEHAQMIALILADKRTRAVEFLRRRFDAVETTAALREMIEADPQGWWIPHHHDGGRQTRNDLRMNGMDEAWFGVSNLDDLYVGLIELAVMGDEYFSDITTLP